MKDLFSQVRDPNQIRGRDRRLIIAKNKKSKIGIRYVAPNGKVFFIEPNGYPIGGPKVFSRWPIEKGLASGEPTHYFGDGYVCLGKYLNNRELYEICYLIDAWARAFEKYLATGSFPDDPLKSFGLDRKRKRGLISSLFG